MHLLENIKEAFRSIHSNLLRTVLTALIVSIGIMSLVGILTAIDAIKYSLNATFASLGANSFEIKAKGYTNRFRRGGVQGKTYPAVTYLQAMQYKRQIGDQAQVGISAFISGATEVKGNGQKTNPNMNVMAGDENYLQIQSYNLAGGRAFSPAELASGANVAIVGTEVKDKLFPGQSPVDKYIYLLGRRFQVVGQLEKSGSSMGGGGADRLVLIPLETGNQMPRQRALTYDIKTAATSPDNLTYLTGEATGVMRAVRHDPLGQEDSFEVEGSDSMASKLDSLSENLRVGGFLVGFITLLGASIALMNIMMVSVTERTREIGIRKALGATALQIRQQFLIEAIVICMLGGLLGILLGVAMGNSISLFIGEGTFLVPWLWMTLGMIICVTVGLASGYYPASKAAALDPIESLRYE
ncbi:putative ABC transport system permease protein [Hymenobacter daecheongensis DSM 21074]|uniref:Putative ABC transport system permease protein n=1 Tax=Hymenobacter daecheongensis DSM 21074 TaxID=1121955 RepID=A0A1M6HNX1_9BACT|nr:ABC transporter permease [Hymenobacter daecheongensis]SHJ23905.1 putative ABC transport system permease protein [Hymenobacter daecheongensis DSM 21074]